jgi:hypothetical protein
VSNHAPHGKIANAQCPSGQIESRCHVGCVVWC